MFRAKDHEVQIQVLAQMLLLLCGFVFQSSFPLYYAFLWCWFVSVWVCKCVRVSVIKCVRSYMHPCSMPRPLGSDTGSCTNVAATLWVWFSNVFPLCTLPSYNVSVWVCECARRTCQGPKYVQIQILAQMLLLFYGFFNRLSLFVWCLLIMLICKSVTVWVCKCPASIHASMLHAKTIRFRYRFLHKRRCEFLWMGCSIVFPFLSGVFLRCWFLSVCVCTFSKEVKPVSHPGDFYMKNKNVFHFIPRRFFTWWAGGASSPFSLAPTKTLNDAGDITTDHRDVPAISLWLTWWSCWNIGHEGWISFSQAVCFNHQETRNIFFHDFGTWCLSFCTSV